ncbi:MAG: transcriptional regulator [Deltaproteobacteria bacterium]|nr:transcriptional regulator [Deltaproteobacteria bacterium]
MGTMLETLVPYLPFDNLSQPSSLINPKDEYGYIQTVVKSVREEARVSEESVLNFQNLLDLFWNRHAVLIPVLWGDKEHHENALHIYLPSSMTTWIYLNLDCKAPDFKFWMAHELGHVYAPGLIGDETSDDAEDFADHFAGALLFSESMALREYKHLCRIQSVPLAINCICERAEELGISPVTVYSEVNRFAEHHGKRPISLSSPNQIYQVMTNFNRNHSTIGQLLFDNLEPSPGQYIASARERFKSPIFDSVREYIKEGDRSPRSPSFLQSILSIPLLDAHGIYEALC